jgi:hypothetical protein
MNESTLPVMTPPHLNFRRSAFVRLLLVCAAGLPFSALADPPAPVTAKQLVEQVVAARKTSGFSARGRMVITKPGQAAKTVQFLVKGRQTASGSDFLYVALYPAADKGRAVVVHRKASGGITGFLRDPAGTATALNASHRQQPLFGSDLTIDELSADFWHWPAPEFKGTEKVCRRDCHIIESRAPKGDKSGTALVRLWISPETSLPLRIESYSADNKLMKRTECTNIVKSGSHYSMEEMTITSPATGQQTAVDFSKGARDIAVAPEEFTAEGITRLLQK